jgi:transcriptional regulator with XRE-family HTH domain
MNSFGELLRGERLKRGKRLVDVARKASIDHAYLSRMERGQRPPPSADILDQIITALGIEPMDAVPIYWAARMLPPAFLNPTVSEDVFTLVRAITMSKNPARLLALIKLGSAAAELFESTR